MSTPLPLWTASAPCRLALSKGVHTHTGSQPGRYALHNVPTPTNVPLLFALSFLCPSPVFGPPNAARTHSLLGCSSPGAPRDVFSRGLLGLLGLRLSSRPERRRLSADAKWRDPGLLSTPPKSLERSPPSLPPSNLPFSSTSDLSEELHTPTTRIPVVPFLPGDA